MYNMFYFSLQLNRENDLTAISGKSPLEFGRDTTETSTVFELDPMNSLKVSDAEITSMIVSTKDDSTWFAQDQRGAIWQLDLSSYTKTEPKVIEQFHGGAVQAISNSPAEHYVATTGSASPALRTGKWW